MASISLPTGLLTLPLPDDLALLHYRALMWAAEHRTDGEIPTAALDVLSRRPDAGELALRLVASGVWTQTAAGWRVITEQRARVSAARSEAGKRGAAVTNGRQIRQTPPTTVPANEVAPRTVHASARPESGTPEQVRNEGRETTTTTTSVPTPEGERVVVAVPASLPIPPREQIEAALAMLSKASQGRFNRHSGTTADREELAVRLAGYGVTKTILDRMGALMRTPSAVWDWAKTLRTGGYISPSWLLGRRDANGERAAVPLEQLVGAARASLAEDAKRQREAAQRAAAVEAERVRKASAPPPMTPAQVAAACEKSRQSIAEIAARRRMGRDTRDFPAVMAELDATWPAAVA